MLRAINMRAALARRLFAVACAGMFVAFAGSSTQAGELMTVSATDSAKDYCDLRPDLGLASCGRGASFGIKKECSSGRPLAVTCSVSDLAWNLKANTVTQDGKGGICVWGAPIIYSMTPVMTVDVLCGDAAFEAPPRFKAKRRY